MEAFFIRVLTAVFESPQLQALLQRLLEGVLTEATNDIKAELAKLEAGIVESIEALPAEIVGDAKKDVSTLLHETVPTADSIQASLAAVLEKLPGGSLLGGFFGK